MGGKVSNYFNKCKSRKDAQKVYHKYSKKLHPDAGGTSEQMSELNNQYDNFTKRFTHGPKYTKQEEFNQKTSFYNSWSGSGLGNAHLAQSLEKALQERNKYQEMINRLRHLKLDELVEWWERAYEDESIS